MRTDTGGKKKAPPSATQPPRFLLSRSSGKRPLRAYRPHALEPPGDCRCRAFPRNGAGSAGERNQCRTLERTPAPHADLVTQIPRNRVQPRPRMIALRTISRAERKKEGFPRGLRIRRRDEE